MLKYVLIIILIILSALFSGSEISYAGSSEIKLRKRAEKGGMAAKLAYDIFKKYDTALVTILIGNNLVNIGSSAVATLIAMELMGDGGAGVATAVMTVLIIIFGEITPKLIAGRKPESFACKVSPAITGLIWLTTPIVVLVNFIVKFVSKAWKKSETDDTVTEDDLETMFETAEEEGVVDEDTAELLQDALDFHDLTAGDILVPIDKMEAFDINDPEDYIINEVISSTYTRLPVYDGDPNYIVGFIHVNQALRRLAQNEDLGIKDIMLKPGYVNEKIALPEVLERMKRTKTHLLIVIDDYGQTKGLITMEDIFEELVGEIYDETD